MSKYDIKITIDTHDNVGGLCLYIDNLHNTKNTVKERAGDHYDCSLISRYENGENYKIMTKLGKLKELTYYLIQLFYLTNKKYSCTQTKIGKLLSILAFKYAKCGKVLFEIPIYQYPPHCGTLIQDLAFIPKDIYVRDFEKGNPDKTETIDEQFNYTAAIPTLYKETYNISEDEKRDIEDIFVHFGAYPANKLGELLNPIVDKLIQGEDEELAITKIKEIKAEDFREECNPIIEYIFK